VIIIFGQRRCGKVDEVPGLCYVQTQFVHVYYVPLIPTTSYIVLAGSESGSGFRGVKTSLSLKSVLVGWVRTGAVLATIGGIIGAVAYGIALADSQSAEALEGLIMTVSLAVGAVGVYWITTRFGRAGYQRALELAEQLGVSQDLIHNLYAGRPAADDPDGSYARNAGEEDDRAREAR
jgi:hypothetical protein